MELMKQPYYDVVFMPIKRFQDLIKWKTELEDERKKIMKEKEDEIRKAASKKTTVRR